MRGAELAENEQLAAGNSTGDAMPKCSLTHVHGLCQIFSQILCVKRQKWANLLNLLYLPYFDSEGDQIGGSLLL